MPSAKSVLLSQSMLSAKSVLLSNNGRSAKKGAFIQERCLFALIISYKSFRSAATLHAIMHLLTKYLGTCPIMKLVPWASSLAGVSKPQSEASNLAPGSPLGGVNPYLGLLLVIYYGGHYPPWGDDPRYKQFLARISF